MLSNCARSTRQDILPRHRLPVRLDRWGQLCAQYAYTVTADAATRPASAVEDPSRSVDSARGEMLRVYYSQT
jgi:hypothetical protein